MISIVLPARNAEATISAALRSVEKQTHRALECIVVDDGSSDRTREIADRFAARDPRFRVLAHAHDALAKNPLVAALNAGAEAARGDWIARMDADDLMRSDRLETQLAAARENDAIGSHVRIFPRAGMRDGGRDYERWIASLGSAETLARDAFVECPIVHPTLLIRRPLLAELRYRDRGWPEDYDLFLRLHEHGARMRVVPERLLSWRDGAARHSRTSGAYSLEAFAACKAHFLARGFLSRAPGYSLVGYGSTGKLLRAALGRESKEPAVIADLKPGRIGQRVDGVEIVGADRLASLAPPIVVSVAGAEPRAAVRNELAAISRRELVDFVCAA